MSNIGTERVYVITDQGVDSILALLGSTWKNRDIQEVPRRKHDDTAFQKTMEKAAAALPPDEYKACSLLAKNTGVSYGEAVEAFLKFPDKPLNERYEWARYTILKMRHSYGKKRRFQLLLSGTGSRKLLPRDSCTNSWSTPNATNAPMPSEMTGDAFEVEPGQLEDAIDGAFHWSGCCRLRLHVTGWRHGHWPRWQVSGIGGCSSSQGERHSWNRCSRMSSMQNYEAIPGDAALVSGYTKLAAAEEKQQFTLFLRRSWAKSQQLSSQLSNAPAACR